MALFSQLVRPVYVTGGISIASGVADKSAFIYGTSIENPSGGVYQDTLPTLTAGQTGVFRVTEYRGLHVNLRTGGGVELLGQMLSASSIPVVLSSDQVLPLPTGAATSALQVTGNASLSSIDGKTPALGQALAAASVPVVLTAAQLSTLTPLSTVTANIGTTGGIALDTTLSTMSAKLPAALGQLAMAASLSVAISSNQSAIPVTQSGTWTVQPGNTPNTVPWLVKEVVSATATLSNVSGSTSSVSLLGSNANRLGATFFNDSTAILYLKFGTTASSTSYTVQLPANAYYEVPGPRIYTGAIPRINGDTEI